MICQRWKMKCLNWRNGIWQSNGKAYQAFLTDFRSKIAHNWGKVSEPWQKHPQIFQRVPLQYIASYLDIEPQSLGCVNAFYQIIFLPFPRLSRFNRGCCKQMWFPFNLSCNSSTMTTTSTISPSTQMMQMITGFWTSCCIYNAAKLDVADFLHNKALSCDQLAKSTHTDASSLYRMMRALAMSGYSVKWKGEFSNTTLSETLRSDIPGSMKQWRSRNSAITIRPGKFVVQSENRKHSFWKVEGMDVWKYYETHPIEGLNFMKAMTGSTNAAIQNVIPMYDFLLQIQSLILAEKRGIPYGNSRQSSASERNCVWWRVCCRWNQRQLKKKKASVQDAVSRQEFFEAVTEGLMSISWNMYYTIGMMCRVSWS